MAKRALANQERRAQAERMSRVSRAGLVTLATLMSFAAVALVVADRLYRPDTFVIKELKIIGKLRHLEPSQIEQLVKQGELGNFFSIELGVLQQQIETLSWVKSAQVRRQWPDTLLITVSEHRPVVKWRSLNQMNRAKEQWVSAGGKVITLSKELRMDSPMVLVGNEKDAALLLRQAAKWRTQLAPSGLFVSEVSLSKSHAWSLRMSYWQAQENFEVLLGREHIEDRLQRFQLMFDKQFREGEQRLIRVDARYPDGLAVEAEDVPEEVNQIAPRVPAQS